MNNNCSHEEVILALEKKVAALEEETREAVSYLMELINNLTYSIDPESYYDGDYY